MSASLSSNTQSVTFCPEILSTNGEVRSNWEDIEWSEAKPAAEPIISATMETISVEITNVVLPKSMPPVKRAMTLTEYRAECERKRQETLDQQAAKELAEKKAAEEAALPASTRRNRRKKELAKARKLNVDESTKNSGWDTVAKTATKEKLIHKPLRKSQRVVPTQSPQTTDGFVNTTLILKNLPYDCSENELYKFFSKCGPVRFVNLVKKEADSPTDGTKDGYPKCVAFVRFVNREGSNKGLEMDGFTYAGRTIYVEYAQDRREKTPAQ